MNVEIKNFVKIWWNLVGGKRHGRLPLPDPIVSNSFLKNLSSKEEIFGEFKISDGAVEIRLTPKEG